MAPGNRLERAEELADFKCGFQPGRDRETAQLLVPQPPEAARPSKN